MWRIFWAALVSATIQYSLTFTGLEGLDASTMIIVVQLEVPLAALLAWLLFKDPLGWRGLSGMLLAFLGIGLIAGAPEQRSDLFPVLLVAGGAVVWAIGQMMIKSLGQVGGFTLIACVAAISGPQLFVSSWLFEDGQLEAIANAAPIVWITVVYLAFVMTALGYAAWYHLLGRYDVNKVIPFLLLVPVTTVLGGVVFLGEALTIYRVVGGVLVIAGVAAITIKKRPWTHEPRSSTETAGIALAAAPRSDTLMRTGNNPFADHAPLTSIGLGVLFLLAAAAIQLLGIG